MEKNHLSRKRNVRKNGPKKKRIEKYHHELTRQRYKKNESIYEKIVWAEWILTFFRTTFQSIWVASII